jgi:hypothetical protein
MIWDSSQLYSGTECAGYEGRKILIEHSTIMFRLFPFSPSFLQMNPPLPIVQIASTTMRNNNLDTFQSFFPNQMLAMFQQEGSVASF